MACARFPDDVDDIQKALGPAVVLGKSVWMPKQGSFASYIVTLLYPMPHGTLACGGGQALVIVKM